MSDDDRGNVAAALTAISDAPIYIDDTQSQCVSQIRSKCRKLKQENGIGLVFIDYVQLIRGGYRSDIVTWGVAQDLKALAVELDCPVIVLSQLRRAVENRSDHRPILSDFRFTGDKYLDVGFLPGLISHSKKAIPESAGIDEYADVVLFLYRNDYYNPDSGNKGIAELITAKHPSGKTGTSKLYFQSEYARFNNV